MRKMSDEERIKERMHTSPGEQAPNLCIHDEKKEGESCFS